MQVPLYQIDAFASELFRGNPAAVCPLDRWLPDETLQAIAAENNLAETAYYVRDGNRYQLRWFTPVVEVDLCGHATLATAYVIDAIRHESAGPRITFDSKSGELVVDREAGREGDRYALNFPSLPASEGLVVPELVDALGAQPLEVLVARDYLRDYLCVFETADHVLGLIPNMEKLATLDRPAVIVTAPGPDCDFVSRFFAPAKGIPEDPVTGSAHCTLIPYWAKRLKKETLFARQISRRGGELWCQDLGGRVKIAGRAVKYMEGRIEVSEKAASA